MASVEVRELRKSFGNKEVLRGVSFLANDGELFCLLGPPGAGKTTLLRVVSGLERPESGTVLLDGQVVNDVPPQQRDVAMVFEDVALYPHLTGFENIAYPLHIKKLPRTEIDRRVRRVAELLHIEHVLKRRPATFSGGERRRVAIARALVRHPRVLLLDQPFTDLDAKVRQEMTAELKRLQLDVGQTMILATHDFEEGMIADRVAVIHCGEVQQIAPPKDAYELPRNTFVAQFIGSPAMNLCLCTLKPQDKGCFLQCPGFSLDLPWRPDPAPDSVYMGIRPEHIVHKQEGEGEIIAKAEVGQILGAEVIVDLLLEGGIRFKWVAPIDKVGNISPGHHVSIIFPPDKVFLFDGKTGSLLTKKEV